VPHETCVLVCKMTITTESPLEDEKFGVLRLAMLIQAEGQLADT
jgi:hypothetical protein